MESHDGRSFATSLFLTSVLQALLERHWLMSRRATFAPADFEAFVALALTRELAPLGALNLGLEFELTPARLKALAAATRDSTKNTVAAATHYDLATYRTFVRDAVRAMTELCVFEEGLAPTRHEDFLPPSTYRAFDAFDDILGLRFTTDTGVIQDPTSPERLYLGGGAGVQTSYATIFSALENLRLPTGGHIIDLGSGFGRIGLIAGLWRKDVRFTGYEYVGTRVKIANDSAERAGLSERIHSLEQDLADPAFQIPVADVYYMYDPFCAATYERVLEQLNRFSHIHAVTVVTKADASGWFTQLQSRGSWAPAEGHDSGLISMFRSRPQISLPALGVNR